MPLIAHKIGHVMIGYGHPSDGVLNPGAFAEMD